MTKFRKIKRKSSRRKNLVLFFVVISLLFVSSGYSILGSNLGLGGILFANHYETDTIIQSFSSDDTTKFRNLNIK